MVDLEGILDIAYHSEPASARRSLSFQIPATASSSVPLLVFIHGGAWRTGSKEEAMKVCCAYLAQYSGCTVAVLEYRLAPSYPHPAQVTDVIDGLSTLLQLPSVGPPHPPYDPRQIILVGHSAGAFMAATIALSRSASSSKDAEFVVPPAIQNAIKGVVCIDGIYDLPALVDEYPSYDSFVIEAFGPPSERWKRESPTSFVKPAEEQNGVKWLVLHSRQDELLSLRQPELWVKHLKGQDYDDADVKVDYDSLKGGHDELLDRRELPVAVAEWLKATVA